IQSHENWNHIFRIKIGFILHFQSFIAFLCILIRLKRNHSRGHVACSPSARGDLSVGALGRAAHSEKYPGGVLGSGTRDTWRLGRHSEELSQLWYSGHVAHSEASGGSITRWTRGALGSFQEGPKCRGTRDTWLFPKLS